ncbi:MAG: DNA-protecting protein DprA [Parcubacteria group bacterium]|nr:DNA-protecting protein DprA [Parcubacteria group bacterium]
MGFFSLQHDIKKIECGDVGANYPEGLLKINKPLSSLYFRGNLGVLQNRNCFAIVGTRRCSDYGKEIAFSFARELAQAGLVIVSGMARGIDTSAHQGALEAGGITIAVLGTGLAEKTIYPQDNMGLAKKILENNGCLVSEYPPEYPGSKYTFPQRNRIISALSLGVLVIEAKSRSGALITADCAKKQGKKLFATPGNIFSLNSKGPHELIKQGAILVEKPKDILEELKIQQLHFSSLLVSDTNRH